MMKFSIATDRKSVRILLSTTDFYELHLLLKRARYFGLIPKNIYCFSTEFLSKVSDIVEVL